MKGNGKIIDQIILIGEAHSINAGGMLKKIKVNFLETFFE